MMKKVIKMTDDANYLFLDLKDLEIEISTIRIGETVINERRNQRVYTYAFHIRNVNNDKSIFLPHYQSINNYENNIRDIEPDNIYEEFKFIMQSVYELGSLTFEDHVSEMGPSDNTKEAYESWIRSVYTRITIDEIFDRSQINLIQSYLNKYESLEDTYSYNQDPVEL